MKDSINLLEEHMDVEYTENGARMYKTTDSYLLDFFSKAGGLRERTSEEIVEIFSLAYQEEPLLALKSLFYTRDIRGGLGERGVFRIILTWLGDNYPDIIEKNIDLIPEFGRWDDLFALEDTKSKEIMYNFIISSFNMDMTSLIVGSDNISLLAKWLPSIGASNKVVKKRALKLSKRMGITTYEYREMVSALREKLDIVEKKMSNKQWSKIKYENVPSYPYEILRKCDNCQDEKEQYQIQAQWNALPNYIDGEHNVLIMADTSGSMIGLPLDISISLAIYFAERNTGPWANKFMTFSDRPRFVELKGETLKEKIESIPYIISNTNLELALQTILEVAVENNLEQKDFPTSLVIISDGEFDRAANSELPFLESIKNSYNFYGYKLPNIVSWNVDSRTNTALAKYSESGIQLVSGASSSVFKQLFKNIGLSPIEAMLNILNDTRYSEITI